MRSITRLISSPGILYAGLDTNKDHYDASAPFRMDAMNGKLNSGEILANEKSADRKSF